MLAEWLKILWTYLQAATPRFKYLSTESLRDQVA